MQLYETCLGGKKHQAHLELDGTASFFSFSKSTVPIRIDEESFLSRDAELAICDKHDNLTMSQWPWNTGEIQSLTIHLHLNRSAEIQAEMFFNMFGGRPGQGTTRVVFGGPGGESYWAAHGEISLETTATWGFSQPNRLDGCLQEIPLIPPAHFVKLDGW